MWQHLYQRTFGPEVELITIAIDPTGADAVRPFAEAAGATFRVLVDAVGQSSDRLGFKAIPNGLLVDEAGVIRYRRDGGFSVADRDDLAAVKRFAKGADPGPSPQPSTARYRLGPMERELITTKIELGYLLASTGDTDGAIKHWQDALHLDPDNLTIRKVIWAACFPERFHPTIDWDWQEAQLAQERAGEIAAGYCGPDGCPLPLAR